jgi:hypothetical protein
VADRRARCGGQRCGRHAHASGRSATAGPAMLGTIPSQPLATASCCRCVPLEAVMAAVLIVRCRIRPLGAAGLRAQGRRASGSAPRAYEQCPPWAHGWRYASLRLDRDPRKNQIRSDPGLGQSGCSADFSLTLAVPPCEPAAGPFTEKAAWRLWPASIRWGRLRPERIRARS